MKLYFLSRPGLLRAIFASSGSVINPAEHLNKINVFPVSDSDTGTSMAHTFRRIYNEPARVFRLLSNHGEVSNKILKT